MLHTLPPRVIPDQILHPTDKVDIVLLENGGPLKGRPVQALARGAVAELCIEGFRTGELVLHARAVAGAGPADGEEVGGCGVRVGRAVLPVVVVIGALGGVAGGTAGMVFGHFG